MKKWIHTLSDNNKPLTSRWTHTRQEIVLKTTSRKSKLVIQGYKMGSYVDFNPFKNKSPVIDLVSIRVIVALTVKLDLCIHQLHMSSTSLYANLSNDIPIYVPLPDRCVIKVRHLLASP